MKNIILSFDDGGEDFYRVAYPILNKFNLTGTVNIISKYIKPAVECDENYKYMTTENLLELQKNGIEIACHGHSHENTVEDIEANLEDFTKMGIDIENIGFASPGSDITPENVHTVDSLIKDKKISYIRSAYIPDRHGKFMGFMNQFMEKSRSAFLFNLMNKRNIIDKFDYPLFMSVVITCYTSMKQIKGFIEKMPDNTSVIIMFHHVYKKTDEAYGKRIRYWDADLFYELCEYISQNEKFVCINNLDLLKE